MTTPAQYIPLDRDAEEIGELYRKAKSSIVESVKYQIECGQRLSAKKEAMPHGEWLPWLKENSDALGFGSSSTASRLIKLAGGNNALAHDLTPKDAIAISRQTWGHEDFNHRAQGTGDNEWYTPSEYIKAAKSVMGDIDIDPASSDVAQKLIGATEYFTRETNGLEKEWHGRIWLNPPYSQPDIWHFVTKLVTELSEGRASEAILLTHNYTDTAWFHQAESIAASICFTRGRIKFVDSAGTECAPTQGQAFFYYGDNAARFGEIFRKFGFVR